MAKGKKVSAYTRYRNNYLARVRRLKKKGITLDEPIPETETQLKKRGITGQQLTKETRKLKQNLKEFESKRGVSTETGEVGTIKDLRKSTKVKLPPEEQAFRMFHDFLEKISHPVRDPSTVKNWKYRKALAETRRQQITLTSLIDNMIEEVGEIAIGRRLILAGAEIIDTLVKGLYDSNDDVIMSCGNQLAEIIKGSPLSLEEAMDLTVDYRGNDIDYEERFIR